MKKKKEKEGFSEERFLRSQVATIPITVNIYPSRLWSVARYEAQIKQILNKGSVVPNRLLKKYFNCFTSSKKNQKLIDKLTKVVLNFFNKPTLIRHGYNFEKKIVKMVVLEPEDPLTFPTPLFPTPPVYHTFKIVGKNQVEFIYTLEGLVLYVFESFLSLDIQFDFEELKLLDNKNNRPYILRFIYEIVDSYFKKNEIKLSGKKSKKYKQQVIAGFICVQLGLLKNEKEFDDADYTGYLASKMRSYSVPLKRKGKSTKK